MRRILSILINLFIAVVAFAAWLSMVFAVSHGGPLTAGGIFSLKFFTTLSNLFNAFVCLFYAFRLIVRWEPTPRFMTWKLASTAAVGLTFLTVTGFFGPAFGYATMYQGSNFWLHLVLPVLSILSFCTLERGVALPFRATFLALIPMLLYSVGYLGNVLIQGVGEWPQRHDFYGFLTWGWGIGAAIVLSLVFAVWILAVILWKLSGRKNTRSQVPTTSAERCRKSADC